MSTRSRDAQHLARLLTERTGVDVRVTWHGPAKDHHGGWHVGWTDGPTVPSMRHRVVPVLPIRAYDRASTDLAEACALLRWLYFHPDQALSLGSVTAHAAYDEQDHPEVAGEETLRRARSLLSLSPANRLELGTLDQVRQCARRAGWDGVLEWLDGISAGSATPGVVDLAEARRRREQAR